MPKKTHLVVDQLVVEQVLVVVEVLDEKYQLHLPRQGNDLYCSVCSTQLLQYEDFDLLDEFFFCSQKLSVLLLLHIVLSTLQHKWDHPQ